MAHAQLPDYARLSPEQRGALRAQVRERGLQHDPRTAGLWREGLRAPLSAAQRQMYLLQSLEPGSVAYNTFSAIVLPARMGRSAVEEAVRTLAERHEVLRSTYHLDQDGVPYQEVTVGTLDVEWHDLPSTGRDHADEADEAQTVRDFLDRARSCPFALDAEWPIRVCVVASAETLTLGIVVHHIAFDGWSEHILWGELRSIVAGAQLPRLQLQVGDVAAWEHECLAREADVAARLAHWEGLLRGAPTSLMLGRHQSDDRSEHGVSHDVSWGPSVLARLTDLADREGTTLYVVLMAAFHAFVGQWVDAQDVVVGSPDANRRGEYVHGLIGNFVNPRLFRSTSRPSTTLAELVRAVRRQAIDGAENVVPFDRLIARLAPDRDVGQPYYGINLTLHTTPQLDAEVEDGVRELYLDQTAARFDLDLNLWVRDREVAGSLLHRTAVLSAAEGARCTIELARLVDALSQAPDEPVAEVARRADVPPGSRCRELDWPARWDAIVRTHAAEVAVCSLEGHAHTYADFGREVVRLAERMRAAGVRPGDRVMVRAPRGARAVLGMLAVLQLRAVFACLDPDDPDHRGERVISSMRPRAVLVAGPGAAREDLADGFEVELTVPAGTEGHTPPLPAGYVIHTSGSSGRPKGVWVAEASLVRYADWAATAYGLSTGSGVPLVTSLSVDLTLTSIFASLVAGQRIVVRDAPDDYPGQGLREALEYGYHHDALSMVKMTPSHLSLVQDLLGPSGPAVARTFVLGGEALLVGAVRDLAAHADRVVFNEYGPAEATVACSAHRLSPTTATGDLVPIGAAVADAALEVVDADGDPVPAGTHGELTIAGPPLAFGYLDDARTTAERFVPDPAGRGRRYLTGDLVRMDGRTGHLVYLGRGDRQVKIRGHRLELAEVEAVVGSLPGIAAVRASTDGGGRLLVQVVADRANLGVAQGDLADPGSDQPGWRNVFDTVYAGESPSAGDDFAGWTSAGDRTPLGDDVMADWADAAALAIDDRVSGGDVLEIGSGTGLMMARFLPACRRYVGTDFSQHALARAHRRLDQDDLAPVRDRAQLILADAADPPQGEFDVVVINSVVQYLEGEERLASVLNAALARLAPGGVLFVGDVRPPEVDATLALRLATDAGVAPVDRAAWADRHVSQDPELRVSPAWWHRWAQAHPRVSTLACSPKVTLCSSELSDFRYDCRIVVGDEDEHGPSTGSVGVAPGRTIQQEPIRTADELRTVLAEAANGQPDVRRCEVVWKRHGTTGLRPHEVAALAADGGLRAHFSLAPDATFDSYEVALASPGATVGPERPRATAHVGVLTSGPGTPGTPGASDVAARVAKAVRSRIGSWAVPDHVDVVTQVDLDQAGKWAARPADVSTRQASAGKRTAPGPDTPAWHTVERVCSELLGREVGPDDDFFLIGGHSLLTFKLVRRLRGEWNPAVSMRLPFDSPVLRDMADGLERLGSASPEPDPTPPLRDPGAASPTSASLSPDQKALWLQVAFSGDSTDMHVPLHVEILGSPDAHLLARALDVVRSTNAGLRMLVDAVQGEPRMRLAPEPPPVQVRDLAHLGAAASTELARLAREQLDNPWDLSQEPSSRAMVVRLSETVAVLVAVHHLFFDARSEAVLVSQFVRAFEAAATPARASDGATPALDLSLVLFAADQARTGRKNAAASDLDWWMRYLDSAPPAIESAALGEPDRPTDPHERRRRAERVIESTALSRLHQWCAEHNLTPFQFLLTAYLRALHEHTGADDLVIATDLGERPTGLDDTIGYFVTQLLLRSQTSDAPLPQHAQRVRDDLLEALSHGAASYDEVVQAIRRVDPDLARAPFRHKITHARSEHGTVLGGHQWRPLATESFGAGEHLTLICLEEADQLVVVADYDASREDPATVEALLDTIVSVVASTEDEVDHER